MGLPGRDKEEGMTVSVVILVQPRFIVRQYQYRHACLYKVARPSESNVLNIDR
jgi:hypothetical protein